MKSEHALFLQFRNHVALLFWPILFWSVKRFRMQWIAFLDAGHMQFEIGVSWYGKVWIRCLDRPDPLHVLRALPSWEALQVKHISTSWSDFFADTCEGRYPWTSLFFAMRGLRPSRWMPACAGIFGPWGISGKKLEPG